MIIIRVMKKQKDQGNTTTNRSSKIKCRVHLEIPKKSTNQLRLPKTCTKVAN